MKRNNWIWLGLLGMVLVVSAGWYWFHNQSANTSDQEQASIGKTATLYLHGYSGGAGSTNTLIRHAKQAGATKVLIATVSKNGKVSWLGTPHHVRKPIVQVVFEDNRNPDAVKWADWLATVNRQLYQRYGVRNVNFVAHSMGNMAVMFYAIRNQDQQKLPKINAYVAIAGHFDGIIGISTVIFAMVPIRMGGLATTHRDRYDIWLAHAQPVTGKENTSVAMPNTAHYMKILRSPKR